jgi:hypothetical protein
MAQADDRVTGAIEVLRRDHDETRRLLAKIAAGPTGTVAATGTDPRARTVEQLVICGSKHEAIEEQYFWPVVRRRVKDGDWLVAQAIGQELELKHVLNLLDGLDPADPEFDLLLRQLASIWRAHLEFEEDVVWPGVRLALSEQELVDLGEQLEQARRLAPTRPHPYVPPDPEVQRLAGRLAGATDRIRDALTGRTGI